MVELWFINVENKKVKFSLDFDVAYSLALELKYKFKGVLIFINNSDVGLVNDVLCWSFDALGYWDRDDFAGDIEIKIQEEYIERATL